MNRRKEFEEFYTQFLLTNGRVPDLIDTWQAALSAAPTPPVAERKPGSWVPVQEAIDEYLSEYELDDGMENYYVPSEDEAFLISDAVQGLVGNEKFKKAYETWLKAVVQLFYRDEETKA